MTPPNGVINGATTTTVQINTDNDLRLQQKRTEDLTKQSSFIKEALKEVKKDPSLIASVGQRTIQPNGTITEDSVVFSNAEKKPEPIASNNSTVKVSIGSNPSFLEQLGTNLKQFASTVKISFSGENNKPPGTSQTSTGAGEPNLSKPANETGEKPKSGGTPQGAFVSTSSAPSISIAMV